MPDPSATKRDRAARGSGDQYSIRTVERAFEVLDFISAKNAAVSITEVARELNINSNMAYRLLMSICAAGYLEQNRAENDHFSLTLQVLRLSSVVLNHLEIRSRAIPYLQSLWLKCRAANVNLAVLYRGQVVQVERIDSDRLPRTFATVGRVLPPHATALGKMLMSESSEAELHEKLGSQPLAKYTENTIDSVEKLVEELKKVRLEGIAWDRGEQIAGDHCVAAPIRDKNRGIVAAVSLSALEIHMSPEELQKAVVPLVEAARSISYSLGFYT